MRKPVAGGLGTGLQEGALTTRRVHFFARPTSATSSSLPCSSSRLSTRQSSRQSSRASKRLPSAQQRYGNQRSSAGSTQRRIGAQGNGESHGSAEVTTHDDPDLGNGLSALRLDPATQVWQLTSSTSSINDQAQVETINQSADSTPGHYRHKQQQQQQQQQGQEEQLTEKLQQEDPKRHQQHASQSRDPGTAQLEDASTTSDRAQCPLLLGDASGLQRLRATFHRIDSLGRGVVEKSRFIDVLIKAGVEAGLATHAALTFADAQSNPQPVAWTVFLDQQHHMLAQEQNNQPAEEFRPSETQPSSPRSTRSRPHTDSENTSYSVAQAMQALAAKYRQNPVTFRQLFTRFDDDKDMELRQEQAVRFVRRAIPGITAKDAEAAVDALPLTNTYPSGVAAVYFHHLNLVYRQFVKHILSSTWREHEDEGRLCTSTSTPTPRIAQAATTSGIIASTHAGSLGDSRGTSSRSTRPASSRPHRRPPSSSSSSTTAFARSRSRSTLRRRPTPGPHARHRMAVSALQTVSSGVGEDGGGDGGHDGLSASTGVLARAEGETEGASQQPLDVTKQRALATQRLLELEAMPQATAIRSLKAKKPPTISLTNKRGLTELTPEEQAAFMSNKPGAGLHLATSVREPVRVRQSEHVMRELVAKHHDGLLTECHKVDLHQTGLISSHQLYRILTEVFDVELSRMAFEHVQHIADCRTDTSVPYTQFFAIFSSKDPHHLPAPATMEERSTNQRSASANRRPSHPHSGRRHSKPFHSQRFKVQRGQTPPVADVHATLMPLLQPRWKAVLEACRRKDTQRQGLISNRAFDDVLHSFGAGLSDDEFSRLARRWAAPKSARGVMYRKFVEKIALGGTGDTQKVATSGVTKPSRHIRQLFKRLRPTVETRFSKIRRAMRAPGISHEQVPASVFFRVLDDHDIQLSKEEREELLALYSNNRRSLVSYTDFLTDVLTA